MESQLLTSSLLRRNSSAPVARINMSAHSENGIKIGWAASIESGPSYRPVCHHQTLGELPIPLASTNHEILGFGTGLVS